MIEILLVFTHLIVFLNFFSLLSLAKWLDRRLSWIEGKVEETLLELRKNLVEEDG